MARDFESVMVRRIEQVERQNRRLKYALATVALLSLGHGLASALLLTPAGRWLHPWRTVEAGAFVLLDEDGQPRATLGMEGESPQLNLAGTDGKVRASLADMGRNGAGLALSDPQTGEPLLSLFAWQDNAALYFRDHQGKLRAEWVVDQERRAPRYFDEAGKPMPPAP